MNVAGYDFEYAGEIEPVRNSDGSVMQRVPQGRSPNDRSSALNEYGSGPFCKFVIETRLQGSGVYLIAVDDEPRYAGGCGDFPNGLSTRIGNIAQADCYREGGQVTHCRLNNLIYRSLSAGSRVSLYFHRSVDYMKVRAGLRAVQSFSWKGL